MYDDTFSLGVAVFLPFCSFEVEISREAIPNTIKEIDGVLDNKGISADIDERIMEIIGNAAAISEDMAQGKIDAEVATSELAYNFVYAFIKKNTDALKNMRGIIGIVQNDQLYIEGYVDQKSYKECTETLKSMSDNDETTDLTPFHPTIH